MINVSDAFKEALKNRSDFQYYASITLVDGTELGEFGPGDIELKNNSLTDGFFSSSFPLGAAVSRSAVLGLSNDDDSLTGYDFYGASIKLRLSFTLDDGTAEEINLGSFTVFTPATQGEVIVLTAFDDMWRTDKPYTSGIVFPASLGEVFRDACESCGLPFVSSDFLNSSFVVQEKPGGEYTFRQIFGFIAMLAGGNARINRNGYMEILSYEQAASGAEVFVPDGSTSFVTSDGYVFIVDADSLVELSEWKDLDHDTDDIVITGVQMSVYNEETGEESAILSGAEGYVLSLEENPLFAGQESEGVALVGGAVNGIQFRRFSGRHVSAPMVEFMDSVKIIDQKGRVYYSIVTDVDFSFLGFTSLLNSAESAQEAGITYVAPLNKAVIAARKLVATERTAREAAITALQEALDNASGFYSTDVIQSDGSTIRYLHDKPTVEESQNVIKITSDAIGFSTDGGSTYPFGIQVNGDVIAKILSAEGINADWINTGALLVKDADGNTVFEADKDNGTVFVNILSGTESVFKVDEEGNLSASRVNVYAPEKPDTFPSGSGFTVWGKYNSWFDVLSIFKGPLDDADVPTVDIYGSSGYGAMGYGSARFNFMEAVFRGSGVFVQDAFGLGEKYRLLSEAEISDYVLEHGVDNGWTWRKWASGVAECWGAYEVSGVDCSTAAGALFVTGLIDPAMYFPDGLFLSYANTSEDDDRMTCQMTFTSNSGTPAFVWGQSFVHPSEGASRFRLMRHTAATISGRMHYVYRGRWKE